GLFLRFTNVTCKSLDPELSTVDYCEMKTLGKNQNSLRMRYSLWKPLTQNLQLQMQLMAKGNRDDNWHPFLYTANMDMCRFLKNRYNYVVKRVFEFIDGHSNLNHSCPFNEKYIAIDDLTNTEISSKLIGLPLSLGFYYLHTKWIIENAPRCVNNFYFEVLNV
ncbi:hypothetical protein KR018_005688, partial [Drosophila ironensis]